MASILIVDDIAIMRKKIGTMLLQAGHTIVAEADDGEQAVREYEKNKPDLVLMDITMPNLDGIGAVKKIISSYPDAKIIMVSALAQKHMVLAALQCGARNYIIKPVEYSKLVDIVKKVLEDTADKDDYQGNKPDSESKISSSVSGVTVPDVEMPFSVENDMGVFTVRLTDKLNMNNINTLTTAIQGFLVIKPINIVFDFCCLDKMDDEALYVIVDAYIKIRNLGGSVKLNAMGEKLTALLVEKYGHMIAF